MNIMFIEKDLRYNFKNKKIIFMVRLKPVSKRKKKSCGMCVRTWIQASEKAIHKSCVRSYGYPLQFTWRKVYSVTFIFYANRTLLSTIYMQYNEQILSVQFDEF